MRRLWAKLPRGWRAVGWIGVAIGIAAALVALPPFEVRNPVVPIVVGLFALTIGVGSWIRGERRIGAYAVATGFSGLVIGYLATVSSIGNLEAVVVWGALLSATLVSATPLVFAALGGLFSERSGVVNIGLEGMMLMGAFFSIWGADKTGHWTLGVLIGVAAGAATGLLHAFFSVTLRADQIVGGTAINFLALGITGYLFIRIYGERGTPSEGLSTVPDSSLDFLYDIPPDRLGGFLGDAFTNTDYLIWTALAMVFVTWVAVFKTPAGLRLRSVGEHPRAADTVGINVYLTRYAAVTLSGALAGGGGRVSRTRLRELVRAQHDSRTRIHRSRRTHLRELAAVRAHSSHAFCSGSRARSPPACRSTRCRCRRCSRRCHTCSPSSPSRG